MGRYLNPSNDGFASIRAGEYVDKSGLIAEVNKTVGTQAKLTCLSRARRFGKSYAAKMLAAYYDRSCDSHALFDDLAIARDPSYGRHLNRYDVIYLDMTSLMGEADSLDQVVATLKERLTQEVLQAYPSIECRETLTDVLAGATGISGVKFVCIIDEWDALLREAKNEARVIDEYITFLRTLFKDSGATDKVFAAAYLTGILPIKKYGTHSAMSDFLEYSMVQSGPFSGFLGFTEEEVRELCDMHGADFGQMKYWYDGYRFPGVGEMYNPSSVMKAIRFGQFGSYWAQTETYEALRVYIDLDMDGVQQAVLDLLAGKVVPIDAFAFQNDMTSMACRDDVLTLLVHLGYLAYDIEAATVRIPNEEIRQEFARTVRRSHHAAIAAMVKKSDALLAATIAGDGAAVAREIERVHDEETSALWYNDEQSLRYVVKFAYLSAMEEYLRVEEMPGGRGYSDIAYIPKKGSPMPLLLVELKWNKPVQAAIDQIRNRNYPAALAGWGGDTLLVGVTYDANTKAHACTIERLEQSDVLQPRSSPGTRLL